MLLEFHDLDRLEFAEVQAAISKIPFLWTEDLLEGGTYITMMYVPVTDMINVTGYISKAFPNLSSRVKVGFVEQPNASSFTIPYNMYQDGRWKFDLRKMENSLRRASVIPIKK